MPPANFSVAVIGSGIGSASFCYFLKNSLGENVDIDVFESESYVGGRCIPYRIGARKVEVGASIAFSGNRYLKRWTDEYNIKRCTPPSDLFGLWNGNKFVYIENPYSIIAVTQLFLRYGLDLVALRSVVFDASKKFDKIYEAQDKRIMFDHPKDLWKHLQLYEYTQQSFLHLIGKKLSTNSLLTSELLNSVNRVNYNQTNELNALAGLGN